MGDPAGDRLPVGADHGWGKEGENCYKMLQSEQLIDVHKQECLASRM
jgi:hypothetical protein